VKKSIVEVIHPTSLKNCRAGHPWITLDEHSAEFNKNSDLLEIVPLNDIYIHDPTHPKIKARHWGKSEIPFDMDIEFRLSEAILKRSEINDRENIFLCFGEVDSLPGMYVLKLGDVILIQYQAYFWSKHLGLLIYYSIKQSCCFFNTPNCFNYLSVFILFNQLHCHLNHRYFSRNATDLKLVNASSPMARIPRIKFN